jgi:phospholipid/cholesterol/gamma-HCH transport system substrate-binding protein
MADVEMSRFTPEAKVGIFFLICAAIFAYAWSRVLDLRLQSGLELKARFSTAEGLVEGAQVQIAGIKVGLVKSLKFDGDSGKVTAVLELRKEYENSIPRDSKVLVRTKGLLGDKYVAIDPGKPNARKLKHGESLESVFEPTSTEKVLETVGVVAQDLQTLVKDARKRIVDDKGGESFERIVKNSEEVSHTLNELLGKNKDKIQRSITNADSSLDGLEQILGKNKEKISKTLTHLSSASQVVDEIVGQNKTKLNSTVDGMERFSRSLDKSSPKFEKLVGDLEGLTKDIRAGKGTMGRLLADDQLYQQISGLVGDVRRVAHQVQHGPGTVGRLINDPEIYFEARRAIRNMNKTAEDVSEATPISTLAIVVGSLLK